MSKIYVIQYKQNDTDEWNNYPEMCISLEGAKILRRYVIFNMGRFANFTRGIIITLHGSKIRQEQLLIILASLRIETLVINIPE